MFSKQSAEMEGKKEEKKVSREDIVNDINAVLDELDFSEGRRKPDEPEHTPIDEEARKKLAEFMKIDPMSNILRQNEISESESLLRGRRRRMARARKLGVDEDVHKEHYFVYSPVSADYCVTEEFCAYTMINWIKTLIMDLNTYKDDESVETLRFVERLYNKYFKYDPEKVKKRDFFRDIKESNATQVLEETAYDRFLFDFVQFRKKYMQIFRRDFARLGLNAPIPAMFKIRGTFDTEEEAVRRVEELAQDTSDRDKVGSFTEGEFVPFNPYPYQARTSSLGQKDVAAMESQIRHMEQQSRNLFLRSRKLAQ